MDNENNQGFLKPEEKEFQTFYRREVWWLGHRAKLKKIGLGVFIVFDAILVLFAGWKFLDAYAVSYDVENRLVAAVAVLGQAELRNFSESTAAAPLGIGGAGAVASGDETNYDLYGAVSNPNADWYAVFQYAFKLKDGETAEQTGFILPGEEKILAFFKATTARAASVDLILREVEWHRVDAHMIPDYKTWAVEHTAQINDAVFSRGDDAATASFVVKNQTAFSFWQPSFLVVLWRGGVLGGLMRLTTAEINSGETKTLSARWFGVVPAVTKIDVYSEINILDPDAYSALEGEQPLDSRTKMKSR